ncbi:MAG: molybdopterin-dependent oxidoreductase [Acidobacteriia bacterium]|nr:molybdopterin-dependent oxidoreductase [Terriglobia bacterium]
MPLRNDALEPDRYELREPQPYSFALDRREFGGLTAGLLLFTTSAADALAQGRGGTAAPAMLSARLHIGDDGVITVFSSKVEVGQGSRTQLTQAAAEELGIPASRIRMVLADTQLTPDDGGTAGSRTTPSTVPAIRKAAAAARKILESKPGARAQDLQSLIPSDVLVRRVQDWQVLGTSLAKVDGKAIVNGSHRYPSDIVRPGMLYGKVLRAPAYNATLTSVDLDPARKIARVIAVRDGEFVACAAPTSHEARKALDAIAATAQWKQLPHPSSKTLFRHLKQTAESGPDAKRRPMIRGKGSVNEAMASSSTKHSASYEVAYIQHVPMEPRAAVAEWTGDSLTVWTGTQMPHRVRQQLAETFHLPADKVRVIVPDTGGGFGGKHTGEVAIEAARLAKEAGKPVSLRWTRAEEFTWAYFRPAGLFEIQAGLDANGRLTAWDYTNYNAGTAGLDSPYTAPHSRTRFLYTDSPLREGSYRGIAATANHFARELFMDELAAAAHADPLAFRLANLEDARLRAVLEAAANRFQWTSRWKKRSSAIGVGIACGTEKGSYAATCVEVELVQGQVRVREICHAYECGAIQNPANLRSQVEGSLIMGLGGALTEEIQFENGKLLNGRMAQYRVPRMSDVPRMELVLLDRKDLPSAGAGETPIIAVAPAIAAAVHHAGGGRVRSMPVKVGL